MVKFHKGDRVKALVNGIDYKVGDEFVLTNDGDGKSVYFDDNAGDDRMRPQEEFELLPVAATGTTESQPATLTIEAGKFYRTRDGRKVGPMCEFVSGRYRECDGDGRWWDKYGVGHMYAKGYDLIAEWVDEPVAQDTNDNTPPAAERQEPRRFKIGDKVRALVDWTWVKAGQEYFVDELDRDGDVWLHHTKHGQAYMADDELELITPVEEAQKLKSADGSFVMDVTNGVLTLEAAQFDIQPKSTLLRTKQGYGFEIARHGDYVWVDTGQKAPIVLKAADVQAAA